MNKDKIRMVHKQINIREDQDDWVEENVPRGEFGGLMRNLLDKHIEECEVDGN